MGAERSRWWLRAIAGSAAVALAAAPVLAQSSVKAVFEKYELLGTFGADCSQPAARTNLYFVNRLVDANTVQRDRMIGPTTREWVTFIEQAVELKPNEIRLSGTRNGMAVSDVWRVEGSRVVVLEVTENGKPIVRDGKYVGSQTWLPVFTRCAP